MRQAGLFLATCADYFHEKRELLIAIKSASIFQSGHLLHVWRSVPGCFCDLLGQVNVNLQLKAKRKSPAFLSSPRSLVHNHQIGDACETNLITALNPLKMLKLKRQMNKFVFYRNTPMSKSNCEFHRQNLFDPFQRDIR